MHKLYYLPKTITFYTFPHSKNNKNEVFTKPICSKCNKESPSENLYLIDCSMDHIICITCWSKLFKDKSKKSSTKLCPVCPEENEYKSIFRYTDIQNTFVASKKFFEDTSLKSYISYQHIVSFLLDNDNIIFFPLFKDRYFIDNINQNKKILLKYDRYFIISILNKFKIDINKARKNKDHFTQFKKTKKQLPYFLNLLPFKTIHHLVYKKKSFFKKKFYKNIQNYLFLLLEKKSKEKINLISNQKY